MTTRMTTAQVATLNAAYAAARSARPGKAAHALTRDVALSWGLHTVRQDDESGTLYANGSGEHVYGWQSGGFDNWVD